MPKASGRILLRKDPDFDVLCVDINIDSFYPARFCRHPTNPPTPDLSVVVSSSGSVYYLQWNFF